MDWREIKYTVNGEDEKLCIAEHCCNLIHSNLLFITGGRNNLTPPPPPSSTSTSTESTSASTSHKNTSTHSNTILLPPSSKPISLTPSAYSLQNQKSYHFLWVFDFTARNWVCPYVQGLFLFYPPSITPLPSPFGSDNEFENRYPTGRKKEACSQFDRK